MPIPGALVIPAQSGIQYFTLSTPYWIPACAEMTTKADRKLIGLLRKTLCLRKRIRSWRNIRSDSRLSFANPTLARGIMVSRAECAGCVDLASNRLESSWNCGFPEKIPILAPSKPPSRHPLAFGEAYSGEILWQFDFNQLKLIEYGALLNSALAMSLYVRAGFPSRLINVAEQVRQNLGEGTERERINA